MYVCNCGKELKGVGGHWRSCKKFTKKINLRNSNLKKEDYWNEDKKLYVCFCGREEISFKILGAHFGHCEIRRKELGISELFLPRKKSKLTREERIEISKKSNLTKKQRIYNRKLTEEHKEKLSQSPNTGFKGVKCYSVFCPFLNKNAKVRGKWELRYALFLNENNIKWRNTGISLTFEYKNKRHKYFPDFLIIDTGEYHEIKGKFWNNLLPDKLKMELVQQFNPNLTFKILMLNDLKKLGIDFNENIVYIDDEIKKINLPKKRKKKIKVIKEKIVKVKIPKKIKEKVKKEKIKKEVIIRREKYLTDKFNNVKEIILSSNIDFSNKKWFNDIAILCNFTPGAIVRWMKKNMKDFYEEKCYKGKYVLRNKLIE